MGLPEGMIEESQPRLVKLLSKSFNTYISSVGGIMVSIAAFQAVDPSSILGHRRIFFANLKIQFCFSFGNS